jgi:hypothetical protein
MFDGFWTATKAADISVTSQKKNSKIFWRITVLRHKTTIKNGVRGRKMII